MYVHHMVTLYAPDPVHASPQAIMEVCLCHHTRRAARAISRLFDEALTPIALKVSQRMLRHGLLTAEAAEARARVMSGEKLALLLGITPPGR